MTDSIFTKIIRGEIPCHKVYEDDKTFAFMDIHPVQPGHVLVVTKNQVSSWLELDNDEMRALMTACQKIGKRLEVLFPDKKRIALVFEGLDVDHVHAKLFPINSGEEFRREVDDSVEPNHDALATMAEQIKTGL